MACINNQLKGALKERFDNIECHQETKPTSDNDGKVGRSKREKASMDVNNPSMLAANIANQFANANLVKVHALICYGGMCEPDMRNLELFCALWHKEMVPVATKR